MHDAGWGQLLRYLAYKAEEAGRQLIAVDPRDTSRTCPACGHCEKDNRPSQAVFRCQACGHEAHADINAAIKILRAGQAQRQQRESDHQPA
ncbi:MAG: RNA-guided endonuclease InsQ/TnpB family protein [Acidimicrobiales bacterium]